MPTRTVRLTHGLRDDQGPSGAIALRVPETRVLWDLAATPGARAAWIEELLAASIASEGRGTVEAVRALAVGDQARLLLELHRLLEGDRLDLQVVCPDCQEVLDVGLRVDDLLDDPADSAPFYETRIEGVTIRFRVPTGADLARAAGSAEPGPALLEALLLEPTPGPDGPDRELLEQRLGQQLSELDPLAEIHLALVCPACQSAVDAVFDPADQVWDDVQRAARSMDHAIHVLASRYHWSEADILALAPERRARYLELIHAEGAA